MDYKTSFNVYHIGFIVALALCFIALLTDMNWLVIIGVIIGAFSLIQTALFYRCPKCKTPFTSKGKIPSHCPGCGYKLDSGK